MVKKIGDNNIDIDWKEVYKGKKKKAEAKKNSKGASNFLFKENHEENYDKKKRGDISENDLKMGEKLFKEQMIEIENDNSVFKAAIYCLLSASERTTNVERNFQFLNKNGFLNPDKLLKELEIKEDINGPLFSNTKENEPGYKGESVVKEKLNKTHWPNQRQERIIEFIKGWKTEGESLVSEIMIDVNNNHMRGREFREIIAELAPGFSYKSASFLLNKIGYANVLPIDLGELRYLKDMHLPDLVEPDYETKSSGMTDKKKYLTCEKKLEEVAQKLGVSLGVLHGTIGGKYAHWQK